MGIIHWIRCAARRATGLTSSSRVACGTGGISGRASFRCSGSGWTQLHLAATSCDEKLVADLLSDGPSVNARDANGLTPLHLAAAGNGKGGDAIVRLLLAAGTDVTAKDYAFGFTPLHAASGSGDSKSAGLLIAAGADVNAEDACKRTPLHVASSLGHRDVVVRLISKALVNSRDGDGSTPLHLACGNGHMEIVKMLIAAKADVNAIDKNGRTPLCEAHNERVKDLLIKSGANTRSISGRSANKSSTPKVGSIKDAKAEKNYLVDMVDMCENIPSDYFRRGSPPFDW